MKALLLGSFNPIHNGHIAIAQYTVDQKLAEEVWFIVSPKNPLKNAMELAPFEDRIEMVRLAISHNHALKVCDIENSLPRPSYTINTLRELRKLYPDEQFTILAGSDIKEQLPLWKEYQEVERLARFLIYPRGDDRANCSPEMADAPLIDITSTECRSNIYPPSDKIIKALHPEVLAYIQAKRLYTMKTIQDYDQLIATDSKSAINYYERGALLYKKGEFGRALNDFNSALEINPEHVESIQMKKMVESIFAYRNTDIYNP